MGEIQDKTNVPMICADFGKRYTMKYGSWRRNKNGIHRCKECMMKALQKKLYGNSEEERNALLKRRNESIRKGWAKQSPEKKKKISEDRRIAWSKNTKRKEVLRERLIEVWKNKSEEERNRQREILSAGRDKYWEDPEHRQYHSERARKKWYAQPLGEQRRIIAAANAGFVEYLKNETPEQKAERLQKMSNGMKSWWANASEEEKNKILDALQNSLREYFKDKESSLTKNEAVFIDFLNKYRILFFERTYFNKIKSDDLLKMFPKNPVTESDYVSAFHPWDFIIHLPTKDVLVDIDGSIHNLEPGKFICKESYDAKDNMAFKDLKRIFQTDDLEAYVVECYDDHMTEETTVRDIYTGKTQTLKDFLIDLSWESLSEKDKEEFIKIAMK